MPNPGQDTFHNIIIHIAPQPATTVGRTCFLVCAVVPRNTVVSQIVGASKDATSVPTN